MITEYTDCTELMRLIAEQKIKPSALKSFLRKQGIIFTATNAETLSKDAYTVFLGGKEMEYITRMIVYEGNYEKSTLINAKMKQTPNEGDVIDYFSDELNSFRSRGFQGYTIEQPTRNGDALSFNLSYRRKLPGKNRLIQEETRNMRVMIRKKNATEVSIDIRQPSAMDASKAIDLLQTILGTDEDAEAVLSHVNLNVLSEKNKVAFFDTLSNYSFPSWRLSTVTGITVKKSDYNDEEDSDEEIADEDGTTGALAGISQAVLNGSGLRSNEFVQNSLQQGYYISSMKYRYSCKQEAGEFVVSINSKGDDLRVDIEKSYCDEDGRLYVQPFPKDQQDEIIQLFQKAANETFYSLIESQKKESTTAI